MKCLLRLTEYKGTITKAFKIITHCFVCIQYSI